jgi:pantoate--beta-alanine ligase
VTTQSFSRIDDLRRALSEARRQGKRIGLVPTMGALHAGHIQLLETARSECDLVVASIFVNPIQFDRHDDLDRYPRPLEEDIEACHKASVDLVFAPSAQEMYGEGHDVLIEPGSVAENLCGRYRPGHFRGVATVVLKLFNVVQPGVAFFGEKDFQQLAVIRQMVAALNVPVEIRPVPTVREPDGLAMSSRNRNLTAAEREAAPALYHCLCVARDLVNGGERDAAEVKRRALDVMAATPQFRVEYLEVIDPDRIQPLVRIEGRVRVAAAAWLGSTRLIDNVAAARANTEL